MQTNEADKAQNGKLHGDEGVVELPTTGKHYTTEPVDNYQEALEELRRSQGPVHKLMILLPGKEQPLTFSNIDNIVLGRPDPSQNYIPEVDLSQFYGMTMGVSRRHAQISFTDGQYIIRDLNSANGTWLNNKRLQPYEKQSLQSGDQLRLGKLPIVVFLSDKPTTLLDAVVPTSALVPTEQDRRQFENMEAPQVSMQTMRLIMQSQDTAAPHVDAVSVGYLTYPLSPYLVALDNIQHIAHQAAGQAPAPVAVQSLRFNPAGNSIEAEIVIDERLLSFLQREIPAYFQIHNLDFDLANRERLPYREIAAYALRYLSGTEQQVYLENMQRELRTLLHLPLQIEG